MSHVGRRKKVGRREREYCPTDSREGEGGKEGEGRKEREVEVYFIMKLLCCLPRNRSMKSLRKS